MKLLTWNINGIRACKISLKQLFSNLDADVICLQETKLTRDQLDDDIVNVENYNAYFSFSKKRSGYSGVATYCRNDHTPVSAEEGLTGLLSSGPKQTTSIVGCYGDQSSFSGDELQALDAEGRTIITQHSYRDKEGKLRDLVIINVYCPRADHDNPERISFKMRFYRVLQLRAEALHQAGKSVIIVGDVNASHRRLDHCDPSDDGGHFESHPSRRWLDGFIKDVQSPSATDDEESAPSSQEDRPSPLKGEEEVEKETEDRLHDDSFVEGEDGTPKEQKHLSFVDTFRFFHPKRKNAFSCWSTKTGARQTNFGTRIDYIIADESLCTDEFTECDIMPDFEGSDHCPVKATLRGGCAPPQQLHPLCAKFMPEFAGKQQKLSSFFQKVSPSKKVGMHERIFDTDNQRQGAFGAVNMGKRPAQTVSGKAYKRLKSDNKAGKAGNIASFFKKKTAITEVKETMPATKQTESSTSTSLISKELQTHPPQDNESPASSASLSESCTNSSSSTTNEVPVNDDNLCHSTQDRSTNSSSCDDSMSKPKAKQQLSSQWKKLLKGPPPAPKCRGHKERCVLRTVKKAGPNCGKQFFVCCRPDGHKNNPEARCNHFEWVSKR